MKNILITLLLLCISTLEVRGQIKSIDINDFITIINDGLENAQAMLLDNDIKIDEATLSLETSYTGTGKVGFNLLIWSNSKEWKRVNSNTFSIIFKDPSAKLVAFEENKSFMGDEEIPLREITVSTLTNAIVRATEMYTLAPALSVLPKDSFSMKLSFRVEKTNSGGLSFELFGLGSSGDANLSDTFVHTLTMKFSGPN